ncbi:unnamed protein product [Rangifer tarandus platyrhynchus]|uniref:Uncharacterized protein n=1 Tax=Rangifer tarandus platyrhynchus TaxID=3082113 RepID=A0AC59YAU1_RANTA
MWGARVGSATCSLCGFGQLLPSLVLSHCSNAGGRRPETRIGAHRALSFASTLGCSRTAPLRRREAAGALGLSALQVRVTPPEGVTGGGAAGRSWSRPRHRRGARVRGAHGRGAGALSAAAVRGAAGGGPPGGPAETAAVH